MPTIRIREATESGSAATLLATAASLNDMWYQPRRVDKTQEAVALRAGRLPETAVQWLVNRYVKQSALDASLTQVVSSEGMARQAVSVYRRLDGVGFPAIMIGAPNGAVAYLAALLRIPFLPSHFLLSFADQTEADDIVSYQKHGQRLAQPIIDRNPDLHVVNHYDPLHDRFLIEQVNHIRLKLLDLPDAYCRFIREHLAPGGSLLFVDCQFSWHQYQIDERLTFQVGGLGGYNHDHYQSGHEELDLWLERLKTSHRGGWSLADDYAYSEERESEWGTLPQFRQAVRRFADSERYDFVSVNGAHPEDYSILSYTAYLWEARLHGRLPQGILVDCFSQINPTAALRSDLLPLWLPFNCDDSFGFLSGMLPFLPRELPVLLSLLANFTETPDLPSAQAWEQLATKIGPVRWIGTEPKYYPMDLGAPIRYLPDLKKWVGDHPGIEPRPHMTVDEMQQMMHYLHQAGTDLFIDLLAFPELEAEEEDVAMEPESASLADVVDPAGS